MRILISNDDGYLAPGLVCLHKNLSQRADVTVVAPDRDRSGASNSLSLRSPLRVKVASNGFNFVDGTPTDCVHLAITGLMSDEPDMVVAGINSGANLGDDVLYSGTVAAATEGRFLGYPAIAVSLVGSASRHFETAANVVSRLLDGLAANPIDRGGMILNVNVPDVPLGELGGFQVTRLGHRHKSEPVIRDVDPQGEEFFWVGPAGTEQDSGPGTDFWAVRHNMVSITPIQVDLTRHERIDSLKVWVETAL